MRKALEESGADLQTFWGGLTVVHRDDLGFNPADPSEMPMFKGEFNSAAKKRKIREVLPIPGNLRPPPELEQREYGSSAIDSAFEKGPRASPPDSRQVNLLHSHPPNLSPTQRGGGQAF